MASLNRRTFLFAGGGALAAQTGPSGRVVVGVIGSGGRGRLLMNTFIQDSAVQVGAVCDVYEPNLENALSIVSKAGQKATAYRNYKQLLDDKNVDAVIIATPEHWHHRMVLDALAAGKDVYVEKPLCQTPEQGVELVEAESKSKNIVQVGMQRRSYDLYQAAHKVVAGGTLGSVRMVRCWWLNNNVKGEPVTKLDGHLDWEQWQGPARHVPFDANRFRSWRYYADYAGGVMADQGAHVYDGVHMLMGAGYPSAVTAAAGRPQRKAVDTAQSVVVTAEYPENFIAVFSINYAAMKYLSRNDQLNQYDGDKARMDIGREDYKVYMEGAEEKVALSMKSEKGFFHATDLHVRNFLECVRTRQRPTAPMALGFQSALVVQMANLSLKHGRRIRWNAAAKKVEYS